MFGTQAGKTKFFVSFSQYSLLQLATPPLFVILINRITAAITEHFHGDDGRCLLGGRRFR